MSNNDAMMTSELVRGSQLKAAAPATRLSGLTEAEIKALARGMMEFLKNDFAPELTQTIELLLHARLRRIDERLKTLEGAAYLTDAGIWNAKSDYDVGMVVTFDGSCWVCQKWHSREQPGKSDLWRLMVKRGKDGRDAPR